MSEAAAIEIKPIQMQAVFDNETMQAAHSREVGETWIAHKPCPDREAYYAMETAGAIVSIGAFHGGELIGYCTAFIVRHPHYDVTIAQHDLLFLAKEHRKGTVGIRLMRMVESEAAKRGVKTMFWIAKPYSQFAQILERTGCVVEECIYKKEISTCQSH